MIPRNSFLFKGGHLDEAKENIYNAFSFAGLIGFPIMFGLAATSHSFIPWFLGAGYEKVPALIQLLSILIICIGFNNVLGIQYLLPSGKDSYYTFTVSAGAGINLIMNIILIPLIYSYGAALATVLAEFLILVLQCILIRKEMSVWRMTKSVLVYLFCGAIMFGVVYSLYYTILTAPKIINSVILVVIGAAVYFVLLIMLRDRFFLTQLASIYKKILKRNIWYDKK